MRLKSQVWSFYGGFQARIQTKVTEGVTGVLSGETQLRSNEGLMWVGGGGGGGGWVEGPPPEVFENGNWETCSCGPCETQQRAEIQQRPSWICEFSTVFQARIQTKVREGGLSDETQLRSN